MNSSKQSEVHSHKRSYVSVEGPTKGELSPRAAFPHPISTKENWFSPREVNKGWAIQMILGSPHGKGHQRAMPNRQEESFKSNKRESINQSVTTRPGKYRTTA
jgi:hypothetical protein